MRSLAIKELWGRRRRLVAALVGVFLGVAFLTGTLVLGDTLSRSIDGFFARAYADTDVSVRNATQVTNAPGRLRGEIDASAVDRIARVPGAANVQPVIQGSGQLLAKDGTVINARGPRTAGNWIDDPALNPYRVVEGRAPRTPDEVVIDRRFARDGHLRVGDRTAVLTPRRTPVTVVGITRFGDQDAFGQAQFTAFSLEGARRHVGRDPSRITGVLVRAAEGVSQEELAARIRPVLPQGAEAVTGRVLAREGQETVEKGFLSAFRLALAAFGAVALLVAAFSIHNTFAITVAQRTRESALLRAVGASRRQVLALVAAEAMVVGVVATLAGLAGGIGCAQLLKTLLAEGGAGLTVRGLVITPAGLLIAALVGVVVTLLAALSPAVRASRVAPLAAMREVATERTVRPSAARAVAGVTLAAVALGAVVAGALAGSLPLTGGGAVMLLAVMVMLGPVAARPAAALAGAPAARLRGVPGRLARDNAARGPRRTAGAATALMVGVGVVTLMTVFAGSLRASVEDGVAGSFRDGLIINGGTNDTGGFGTDLTDAAARLPQVEAAAGIGRGNARLAGENAGVRVADPARLGRVLDLDVTAGALSDTLAVSEEAAAERGWRVGTPVPVLYADGSRQTLTVGAVYRNADVAGDYLIPRTAWNAHNGRSLDGMAFVKLRPGASEAEARDAISALARPHGAPPVQDRDGYVAAQTADMSTFLSIVYGMLALAIVIALLGIANTLSLSVHERTRELGLLRAVGATRPQVRSMVRWEAVIVALFGTAGGAGLGLFAGWGLTRAMGDPFAALPVQLGTIVLVGAVAGVLASVRPARRAAARGVLDSIAAP
ncbi:ABC transporter substrate-binding protein [Actinomadura sp. NBRC 104412]|uniref:ABC transporter permease n=1 Tax=Actinomadura sp. NBRC 104412 TaxID=3032203 RepID=UPI0024A4045C|nr:ABC transporter permease [Actinomadura sp. NBRC 104412]GLZ05717.1 ABC transporter substrate-binding protein [Actinomadura sp. NBRC 104412]